MRVGEVQADVEQIRVDIRGGIVVWRCVERRAEQQGKADLALYPFPGWK